MSIIIEQEYKTVLIDPETSVISIFWIPICSVTTGKRSRVPVSRGLIETK